MAKFENEYILCAAIKRLEPRQDTTMYYNNDICNIEIGYRHHDIIRRFQNEISRNPKDQGFYTSKGRFVNREEAMEIAYNAKQIKDTESYITTPYFGIHNFIHIDSISFLCGLDICNIFGFDISFEKKTDHAGIGFSITLFGVVLRIGLYDVRHWDYENNCWEN